MDSQYFCTEETKNITIMLSRDLIATVIKTFFEELDDVRNGDRPVECEAAYAGLYKTYFNKERSWFLQVTVSEITIFFADDPVYKLEMLTELMYRDAFSLTDIEVQRMVFQKILELYEVIDIRSREFSMERMNRTLELKNFLA